MKQAMLIFIFGGLFMGVISIFTIPLPWSPIPLSVQSLGVSILSIIFLRQAWIAILGYLMMASLGLPVLAGGEINTEWFLSPRVGYYLGFLIASILVGNVLERIRPSKFLTSWCCLALNESTILFAGWVGLSLTLSPEKAWALGVFPFLLGAIVKITVATIIWTRIKQGEIDLCKQDQ